MNEVSSNHIYLIKGGWGDVIHKDLLEVLKSTADLFLKNIRSDNLPQKKVEIISSSYHNPPIENPIIYKCSGYDRIYLTARDKLWCKYAYQFAHEYCHHIISSKHNDVNYKFGWFEEALCELASINSILHMSKTWLINPPYQNWKGYSVSLKEYAMEIIKKKSNEISKPLSLWITESYDSLSQDRYQREKNRIVAVNILDLFIENPLLWNTICFIRNIEFSEDIDLLTFIVLWGKAIPYVYMESWISLSKRLLN